MPGATVPKTGREELFALQAGFCKGMAHPTRMRLLESLRDGEKRVSELAEAAGVTQANASQHLAVLRQFGLLGTRRSGSAIYYRIRDRRVAEVYDLVRNCVEGGFREPHPAVPL